MKTGFIGLKAIILILGVLMSFIVISSLYQQAYSEGADAAKPDICRNSVLLRSQATITDAIQSGEKLTPLNCQTKDVEPAGINEEEEAKRINELMSKCWYMFAEGRVKDLFKAEGGQKQCHVCYQYLPANSGLQAEDILEYSQEHQVNPSDFRGVGTTNYIGDGVDMKPIAIEPQTRLALNDMQAPDAVDFVDDPANYVQDSRENQINEDLRGLLRDHNVSVNVVIADRITDLSRGDVHDTMQRIQITGEPNATRGIMITVSLSDERARLDVGSDLQTKITEPSISKIMRPMTNANLGTLGDATQRVINNIKRRFNEDPSSVVERGSYYDYLTRGGATTFAVPEDIDSQTPYAIAYVSPSNDQAWDYSTVGKEAAAAANRPGMTIGMMLAESYFTNNDKDVVTNNFITLQPFTSLQDRCRVRA